MRKLTHIGNFVSSRIGKAIGDYGLIEANDRILVAVSGGKDSLTLLKLLRQRQEWSPVKYDLIAAHIETDFQCSACVHSRVLESFFKEMGVPHLFGKTSVLDKDKRTNCFWCSWNRRKTLFEMAEQYNCNKVAFGHHKDDIIETTLLNLFFQGEFSTMNPRQELFNGKVTIIRPLCYVEERKIKHYARENGFPEQLCKCPYGRNSNRRYLKEFIKDMEKRSPDIKTNIFKSISRIKHEYLALKQEHLSCGG